MKRFFTRLLPIANLSYSSSSGCLTAATIITSTTAQPAPVDPTHLLRVCTTLYQHQNAPDQKLHSRLNSIGFDLSHEFFLQVCNRFPFSWKPIHRLYLFTLQHQPTFHHTTVTTNKVVDVLGGARNVPLLWDFLLDAAGKGLANEKSYVLAARYLAEGRQIRKLVGIFGVMERHNPGLCDVGMLNGVVGSLCDRRLVVEAEELVRKMRASITPDGLTYGCLVVGFCRSGDLVEACKVWNKMVEGGLEVEVKCYEEMLVTFFKRNRFDDAIRMFKAMRDDKLCDMGSSSYGCMISWLCRQGKVEPCMMLMGEMVKRGVGVDGAALGDVAYGLLVRRKVREACRVLDRSDDLDVSVYHGLIKGFLRLRRLADATQVFRLMSERGCEPTMHTYIMLLQGHMGKKGRKGRDRDPLVNFDCVFVGGLVKVGRTLEATKYVERMMWGGKAQVPRFDYNRFLHSFSNEEGVVMFEEVGRRMKEVGMLDVGDVFLRYGEKMATRDRRRRLPKTLKHPTTLH